MYIIKDDLTIVPVEVRVETDHSFFLNYMSGEVAGQYRKTDGLVYYSYKQAQEALIDIWHKNMSIAIQDVYDRLGRMEKDFNDIFCTLRSLAQEE